MGAAHAAARQQAQADIRFEDAEADFHKAGELGRDDDFHYALLMNRGAMRFQQRRYSDAVADFEAATALDRGHYNAYASLAQALRQLGRRDEALEQLRKAIALEPEKAALYRGRALTRLERDDRTPSEVDMVIHDLEESARLEPPGSRAAADDHARRGRLLLRLARPREALAAADAALAIAPDLADAHLVRIAILLDQDRHDQVIAACNAALAKGPPSAALHLYRGLGRTGRHDFPGAIDDYTRALVLHPDNRAEIHLYRGWAYLLANAVELALNDFEEVIRLDPDNPGGYAGRGAGRVRRGLLRNGLADAEESLRRAAPTRRILYIAAQTYAQASALAAAEVASRRPTSRDSLAYEARATSLLHQVLKQIPTDQRPAFWRDILLRDDTLRPLLHNPRILQRLKALDLPAG